jgi:hypothetical protein
MLNVSRKIFLPFALLFVAVAAGYSANLYMVFGKAFCAAALDTSNCIEHCR